MEIRKLQLIGGSSYMVSLPKEWVKDNRLKQGDEIYLQVEDSVITIYPRKFMEIQKIARVEIPELPSYDEKFLRRYIYALYIQGLDEISIRDKKLNARLVSKIGEIAKDLIGMEIIDAGDEHLKLKCLAGIDFDMFGVVKRLTQIIKSMLATLQDGIYKKDFSSFRDIKNFEDDADRLYLLAVRQEHKLVREFSSPAKWNELRLILGIRTVAKLLEEIADSLCDFSEYAKKTTTESLTKHLKSLENSFNLMCAAYFNSNTETAESAIRNLEALEEEFLKVEAGDLYYRLSLEALLRACRHMKSISEIAFNKSVRESIQDMQKQIL